MYGYNEIISLTPEQILEEVTQEEIFSLFIKKEIIIDKHRATYVAPYRDDKKPDCYFEEYDGKIYFVDFADTRHSKSCFSFIERCTGLAYPKNLQFIVKELNLGKGNRTLKTLTVENSSVEVKKIKEDRTITYAPRKFSYKDKKFWEQYGITRQQLEEDKVIPVDTYKSTSRKGEPFVIKPFDITYAYTDFDNGRVKIYRPYGEKTEKWFTNCTQNDIGSINHLPISGDKLIISKSYKDCRVLRNQGLNSVWLQNEGMIPKPTLLRLLCKRFKEIIIWFDNDQAGIKASRLLASHISSLFPGKVRTVHLDISYLEKGIKDPSDLISKENKQQLSNFITTKKLN